jgi:hypothetical protein
VKVDFGGTQTTSGSIYYWGGHTSHTGQILFNDSYTTLVQTLLSYSSNTDARTLNSVDRVYTQQDGVDSTVGASTTTTPAFSSFRIFFYVLLCFSILFVLFSKMIEPVFDINSINFCLEILHSVPIKSLR